MKFVAVVAGAGALAFLGALVCIVASVYSRAPAVALQPPAAVNGTVSPVPSGSLGALYGADTSEREPLSGAGGTGRETPVLGELSAGVSPQRFTFSRLLCSPVPPADCAMKRRRRDKEVEHQAEYEDEDWSALSATAEELRRTVALQSAQIAADRKTIDELTGKLAECESALLDERSVAERGAAASWPARRRLMAGDGVRESAAAQLHTARAVEELERAILQLKDRIEKLEMEMVPALLNHSEVAAGSTGVRLALGQPDGRVEDVGEELVQKVKQLEEERKSLRKETQNHHQHINQGINTLQDRISELEQSFTQSFPQGYKLSFPIRTNYMYGLVRRNIPDIYAFTACVWLKATESGIGTPFSYAVDKQPNELVLLQGVHNPAELLINAKVAHLPLSFPPGTWQHICVSWTLRDGVWKAYQGGKLKGRGEGLSAWHPIRAGGVLVLGQEQDMPGGQFDASQALVGEMSLFNLWDRVLLPAEISTMAACGEPVLQGTVVSWTDQDVDVFGGATKEPVDPCSSGAGPQK